MSFVCYYQTWTIPEYDCYTESEITLLYDVFRYFVHPTFVYLFSMFLLWFRLDNLLCMSWKLFGRKLCKVRELVTWARNCFWYSAVFVIDGILFVRFSVMNVFACVCVVFLSRSDLSTLFNIATKLEVWLAIKHFSQNVV